jgi:hypothetical protein
MKMNSENVFFGNGVESYKIDKKKRKKGIGMRSTRN